MYSSELNSQARQLGTKTALEEASIASLYLCYLVDSMASYAPPCQQAFTEMSANCDECSEGF